MKRDVSLKVPGVYGLIDPRTNIVRYVGQSKNIYNRYYSGHLKAGRVSNHPVSMWVSKLREEGMVPGVVILEKHDDPASIEKDWIAKMRNLGCDLLNIHEGGRRPASTGNGVTTKIWSVKGLPTPWIFLCRSMLSHRKNKSVSETLKRMKQDRDSRETEFDKLKFELACARILLENYGKETKQVQFAERWLMGVADKVNAKYPDTVIVMSVDGDRLT